MKEWRLHIHSDIEHLSFTHAIVVVQYLRWTRFLVLHSTCVPSLTMLCNIRHSCPLVWSPCLSEAILPKLMGQLPDPRVLHMNTRLHRLGVTLFKLRCLLFHHSSCLSLSSDAMLSLSCLGGFFRLGLVCVGVVVGPRVIVKLFTHYTIVSISLHA